MDQKLIYMDQNKIEVLVPGYFFCLALVPVVCKKFVIGPYVNFKLKKMLKLTVCHVDQ